MRRLGQVDGSEARLWGLIEERARPEADVAAIDARIWDLFGEQWCVLFTDLSGFSRQTARYGVTHFLQVIFEHERIAAPILARFDGILVKAVADSLLVLFKRPAGALACSLAIQRATGLANERRHPEEHVLVSMGLGYGKVLKIGDADVFGEAVNAAAKLGEDTAGPSEILATAAFVEAIGPFEGVFFEPIAEAVPGSPKNFRACFDRAALPP